MEVKELLELNKKYKDILNNRKNKNDNIDILVCGGTGCTSSESMSIIDNFKTIIKEKNINNIRVIMTGCFGLCSLGPIVIIKPNNTFYTKVKINDCEEIIDSIINNTIVDRLLYKEDLNKIIKLDELPFYKKQKRIVLENCGFINPEDIYEYIGVDGYLALKKVMFDITKENVIEEIKNSGLRGRGGAGFKTGLKWEMAYLEKSKIKYVACNADEGDPGAFMDRSILEGNPHSVIEAMTILAYTIGATEGFIYIRHEYPIAVKRLQKAIDDANKLGLLGNNILGTNFNFNITLRLGAGAFVCGEETALMESVMGRRGEPRLRPPFPTTSGIFNEPTVLNNVETYANITKIILNGSDWFNKIGSPNSPGTKVFSLGGDVVNTGLIEVPMGTTLREIIYDIGGGIKNNKEFKFAQTGGPSGGCIPSEYLDIKIDFDELKKIGTIMGSGGLIVVSNSSCSVDIAKFFLDFSVNESCGKCTPCRLGNKKILDILTNITDGKGKLSDIEELENLCNYVKDNSLCGLGQSSPNPVLSTLRFFKEEYISHINGTCPAHVCTKLVSYKIDENICKACGLCKRNCPAGAIIGELKTPHKIDKEKCLKCGLCYSKCPFKAIIKE